MPADVAWRLLSRTIDMDAALRSMAMAGEERLAAAVTGATAIMYDPSLIRPLWVAHVGEVRLELTRRSRGTGS